MAITSPSLVVPGLVSTTVLTLVVWHVWVQQAGAPCGPAIGLEKPVRNRPWRVELRGHQIRKVSTHIQGCQRPVIPIPVHITLWPSINSSIWTPSFILVSLETALPYNKLNAPVLRFTSIRRRQVENHRHAVMQFLDVSAHLHTCELKPTLQKEMLIGLYLR
jgi:hypothetical protein